MIPVGAPLAGAHMTGAPARGAPTGAPKTKKGDQKDRLCSSPYGNRTRVSGMKILRPDP